MNQPTRRTVDVSNLRGILAVAALALILALAWWWTGRSEELIELPRQTPQTPIADVPPTPSPTTSTSDQLTPIDEEISVDEQLFVDVRGAVKQRGIQRLAAGSRVLDAIEQAGGMRSGHGYGEVNLARPLVDGEQIWVGKTSRIEDGVAGANIAPETSVVNVNTADVVQLQELDGVGEVLAERIVTWRTEQGPFRAVEDLVQVPGIGDQTLAGFRDAVTI